MAPVSTIHEGPGEQNIERQATKDTTREGGDGHSAFEENTNIKPKKKGQDRKSRDYQETHRFLDSLVT